MKIGDELQLVHKVDDCKRTVVGFLSNGEVVYEFNDGRRTRPSAASRPVSEVKVIVPKKKGWLNIYPSLSKLNDYGYVYKTKAEADADAIPSRIDCIEIEYNAEAR